MKYLLFTVLLCGNLYAQNTSNTFIIRFTDKNNSSFSITSPQNFLSQRAINRRSNQGIAVSFQDIPVNQTYINQLSAAGLQILNRSKWLNAVSVYCTDSNIIQNIQNLPFVASTMALKKPAILPVDKYNVESTFNPSERFQVKSKQEISTVYDYGASIGQIAMLGGDLLHTAGFDGQGKLIAVIDAGFLIADQCETFDSLFANNQILATWDFVSGNNNVYDDHYHGTYVLSIMGGNSPGSLIGAAPKANYLLLRSEDAVTEYLVEEFNWVCAAEYADSAGADVINSSLGYTTFDNPTQNHTYSDLNGITSMASKAASWAASKGIIVCNSAGNSGNSPWFFISVPADADSILTVGAVDANELVANFSSRGNTPDGRIKPDVAAQGVATVGQSQPGVYDVGNGTSFSSPLVAGMCASLWQGLPNFSAAQIIQKVKESCDQYSNPDSLKGYGIPNFSSAYFLATGKQIVFPEHSMLDFVGPNPFADDLRIKFYAADTQHVNITLYDISGRKVFEETYWCHEKSYNELKIPNTSILTQGVYLLDIQTKQERFVRKLIKR